jgi:hypothetical protein
MPSFIRRIGKPVWLSAKRQLQAHFAGSLSRLHRFATPVTSHGSFWLCSNSQTVLYVQHPKTFEFGKRFANSAASADHKDRR